MKYFKTFFLSLTLLLSVSCYANSNYFLPWTLRLFQDSKIGIIGGYNGGYDLKCSRVELNRGYFAGIKLGQDLLYHIRLEEELCWQRNDVNTIKRETCGDTPLKFDHASGHVDILSLMTNAYYDLPFNCEFPARPYIGGGLGCAFATGNWKGKMSRAIPGSTTAAVPPTQNSNETSQDLQRHLKSKIDKGGFAWQFIAGLNFSFCCVSIGLEYRYFKTHNSISNHKIGLSLARIF